MPFGAYAPYSLIDAVSAYNHIFRTPILEEIAASCPELLCFTATFLCRHSTYVFYARVFNPRWGGLRPSNPPPPHSGEGEIPART